MAESLIGIRIILVEDHDDCREIFATMLRFHGAVVTALANAREAIGIVAHADIVVTDFSMSGGDDGAWLLDRVNEQPRPNSGYRGSRRERIPDRRRGPRARAYPDPGAAV